MLIIEDTMTIAIDWEVEDKTLGLISKFLKSIKSHDSINRIESDGELIVDITDCINLFTLEENLTSTNKWFCSNCNQLCNATKKLTIKKLPHVLIIHLKRFQFDHIYRNKITTVVGFPLENLDLTHYVQSIDNEQKIYDLYGITNHYGDLSGGHYTSYCKNRNDGTWYYLDDSSYRKTEEIAIEPSSAYLLFYISRSCPKMEWQELIEEQIMTIKENIPPVSPQVQNTKPPEKKRA